MTETFPPRDVLDAPCEDPDPYPGEAAAPVQIAPPPGEAVVKKNGDAEKPKRPSKEPAAAEKPGERQTRRWQERLLPLMTGLLIGLTIFFFLTTVVQMAYLHWSILQFPAINLDFPEGNTLVASAQTFDQAFEARRLEVMTRMEAYMVERRYHQASVALMAGLWLRYLGFVTGMIIALVGASFVLGKLREPVTEISGKTSVWDLSLKSASPGIILAVLGALLMFSTIVNYDHYEIQDSAIYLSGSATRPAAATQLPKPGALPAQYPTDAPGSLPTASPPPPGP